MIRSPGEWTGTYEHRNPARSQMERLSHESICIKLEAFMQQYQPQFEAHWSHPSGSNYETQRQSSGVSHRAWGGGRRIAGPIAWCLPRALPGRFLLVLWSPARETTRCIPVFPWAVRVLGWKHQTDLNNRGCMACRGSRSDWRQQSRSATSITTCATRRSLESACAGLIANFTKWRWNTSHSTSIYGSLPLLLKQKCAKKLRKYEESVGKEQIAPDTWNLMNCLCNKRGWLSFRIYTTNWIPCQMQETFTILKQPASLERPTFPVNPWPFRVPDECPAAILDCRLTHGILRVLQEKFLKAYLEMDHPQLSSRIHGIWHHLLADWDLILQETLWDMKEGWDESRRVRQYLHHAFKRVREFWIILEELILTMVSWITRDFRSRKCILVNSQTPMNFKSSKVSFKTEVCSMTTDPQNALDRRSRESKVNWRAYDVAIDCGRGDFTDYDMLDAMIASSLKRLLNKHVHFRKRVSVEEQRAQKDDRFLRGRQIASMIYEHFRATGSYEAVQSLSIFSIFAKRMTIFLEGFYKSKNAGLCSASDCIGSVWTRDNSK